ARDYVRLVSRNLAGVRDVAVAQTLQRQAVSALIHYVSPEWQEEGFNLLASRLRELLTSAAPGSDLQLAYAHGFAETARAPEHLSLLRGIYEGAIEVEGLKVDTDLRWALLRRLVAAGAAGEAEINAELERDPTAAGERAAAGCRAAIPTAEAKAAAWERITSGTLANAEFRATLGGFVEPAHAELLRPYVDRYFGQLADAWAKWTAEFAQTFTEFAYPGYLIEEETLRRTDAYLETENPVPALRRLLLEGRAGVERALHARAQDA